MAICWYPVVVTYTVAGAPAAAAAAALGVFPGHPQVAAASYGYAPLSPGKTRYLY